MRTRNPIETRLIKKEGREREPGGLSFICVTIQRGGTRNEEEAGVFYIQTKGVKVKRPHTNLKFEQKNKRHTNLKSG